MKNIALIATLLIYTYGYSQTPSTTQPTNAEAQSYEQPQRPSPTKVDDSSASPHLFGFNVGIGFPYLFMAGLNYVHPSGFVSAELAYNNLSITSNDVSVAMTKTEVIAKWHPFAGSFYLGLGFGNSSLSGTSKETISGQSVEAKIEIKSTTMTPQIGWMWGVSDGGFFAGIDFGFQNPSGVTSTLTTTADAAVRSTADYQKLEADVRDQGKKLGEIGIPTTTLIRLGYLF